MPYADIHLMETSDWLAGYAWSARPAKRLFYSGDFADMMGMAPAILLKDPRL
jgi:hypothetical protein